MSNKELGIFGTANFGVRSFDAVMTGVYPSEPFLMPPRAEPREGERL